MEALISGLIIWLTNSGIKLVVGIIILSIGFKIIDKLVERFIYILEKRSVDNTIKIFLRSLISSLSKVILVMTVIDYWGVDLTGVAALLASAGVAVGLALQGSLSNFAGGFIILLLRPFKVGDYIETGIYSGGVEQIGLFYTYLITPDNKQILIPNGNLANGSLINYTTKDTRRVDMIFSASYDNDINHVKEVLSKIVENNDLIIRHEGNFIGVLEHANSSVNFAVRVWVKSEDYFTVYFNLLEEVKLAFEKENISIPYPHMDININK